MLIRRSSAASPDTDTTQLQLLIQEVLCEQLPGMVRELLAGQLVVTETGTEIAAEILRVEAVTEHVTDTVADAATETVTETSKPTTATDDITDAVTEMQGEGGPRMTPQAMPDAEYLQVQAYDTEKHYLGKLCPRRHNWHGTGQSLLRKTNHVCLECDREKTAERQQAKRRGQAAAISSQG